MEAVASKAAVSLLKKAQDKARSADAQLGNVHDPYRIFWINPDEPRHSKFLAYLLAARGTSDASHGFGLKLLKLLLTHTSLAGLPVDRYAVRCEKRHPRYGQIDLAIVDQNGRWAVIIENKVNGAGDQPAQIARYHRFATEKLKIAEANVYCVYLTLRATGKSPGKGSSGKCPADSILRWSYQSDIQPWLTRVERGVSGDLRETVRHYRRLIEYRIQEDKELRIQGEVVRILQAERDLPDWADLRAILESKGAPLLANCYLKLQAARMLLKVRDALEQKKHKAILFVSDDVNQSMEIANPHDGNLEHVLAVSPAPCVGIEIGGDVYVALTVYPESADTPLAFEYGTRDRCRRNSKYAGFIRKAPECSDVEVPFCDEQSTWYRWAVGGGIGLDAVQTCVERLLKHTCEAKALHRRYGCRR